MNRADRLEAVVTHLRARQHTTVGDLARELGVSARTIRRDVADLRRKGMEIEGDRGVGGGIRFSRYAPLPPLRLDEGQAVGLWLSVQIARRVAGLPFSRGTSTGLHTVLSALPCARRSQLRRLYERIRIGTPASTPVARSAGDICPTLLDTFERSFSNETCLSFQYSDRFGAVSQRRVAPHGILVKVPVWYILAIDVDKDLPRAFRMDRIAKPRPTGRPFRPSWEAIAELEASLEWMPRPGDAEDCNEHAPGDWTAGAQTSSSSNDSPA